MDVREDFLTPEGNQIPLGQFIASQYTATDKTSTLDLRDIKKYQVPNLSSVSIHLVDPWLEQLRESMK